MDFNRSKLILGAFLSVPLILSTQTYAATPINLDHQSVNVLQTLVANSATSAAINLKEINRALDFKNTLHVRVQETYAGYPVYNSGAILHIPHGAHTPASLPSTLQSLKTTKNITMEGVIYQDLKADLNNTPAVIFTDAYANKAIQKMIMEYQNKAGASTITDQKAELLVYVDKNHKARWAYKISLSVAPDKNGMPAEPVYLVDANSFLVYAEWNDIETLKSKHADPNTGGGFGGNIKMGKLVYDGLINDLPTLNIDRDDKAQKCYLENQDVVVKSYLNNKVINYACEAKDPDHNNIYWDADLDQVNGGFSPGNDALFGGAVIKDMYQKWYNLPVLVDANKKPLLLTMVVHDPIDNAFWNNRTQQMTFGDGVSYFYPLTSLGVAAHEISHGFTFQQSNLAYFGQSGGLNESFSDMAAQAAEFYAYGKNSWQIAPEIFKKEGEALRYMDQPSKDCHGKTPGSRCSIDDASQYYPGLDVHYSSGVFNRAFYLIATSPNWDVRKAFNVMVQANIAYWGVPGHGDSTISFANAACGVIKATKDRGYDVETVQGAFDMVKVDTSKC